MTGPPIIGKIMQYMYISKLWAPAKNVIVA